MNSRESGARRARGQHPAATAYLHRNSCVAAMPASSAGAAAKGVGDACCRLHCQPHGQLIGWPGRYLAG